VTASFIGAFGVACGVLMVSGAFKLVQPGGVAGAVQTLGMRVPRWGGRLIGSFEIGVGAAGLAVGGPIPSLAVATAYLAFAVVGVVLMRRGEVSCGCFGQIESPPSGLHVAIDLGAATAALGHAAAMSPSIFEYSRTLGWEAIPFLGLIAVGVLCTVAILTVLPAVVAQTRAAAAEADARHERLHHQSHGTDLVQIESPSDPG
jgi:hypothetical protein